MSSASTGLVSSSSQPNNQLTPSRPTQTLQYSASAPTTPKAIKTTPAPSPGSFKHPRLKEIISRQNRTTFDERNIRSATLNAAVLLLSVIFGHDLYRSLTSLLTFFSLVTPSTSTSITSTAVLLLRILFLSNTILSLRPIIPYISQKDTIIDIPLTPSQRALLGLPPSTSKPATPLSTTSSPNAGTSGYITPPRYQRQFSGSNSSTPSSQPNFSVDRRSISANYSSSPMSTSRYTLGFSPSPSAPQTQPQFRRTASGSPFSPTASPLFQKAIRHQHNTSQDLDFSVSGRTSVVESAFGKSSLGSSSGLGLGRSQSVKERGARQEEGKASPIAQKGVNYKWLYDKGFTGVGTGKGVGGLGW